MPEPPVDRFHPESWSLNPERGLWRKSGPGHTEVTATLDGVHDGTVSASLVLVAAQMNRLSELPIRDILVALRDLQLRDPEDPFEGCLRWYAEETRPVDSNASFFIGLNLIVLRLAFADELADPERDLLDDILRHLLTWFRREVGSGIQYYPNKFLGDLVCAWLLHEIFEEDLADIERALLENATYYERSHFAWGEHLSDPYTTIMLDELSCLLLLARHLPRPVFQACKSLFDRLLEIEDAFVGGPRVPTIRSYAFRDRYHHRHYRDGVFSWRDQPDSPLHPLKLAGIYKFCFGQLFHDLGWHRLASPQAPAQREHTIPCFGGSFAKSWITASARLGTLSRYPIMPVTDEFKYGLSWQTMPLALAVGKAGWGFLRWGSLENGDERFHPAKDKHSAYLRNALSEVCRPPITGQTFSVQFGPSALLYRRMPQISQQWDWLSDTFTLAGFDGRVRECGSSPAGFSRLRLQWDDHTTLHVFFHPLDSQAHPALKQVGRHLEWGIQLAREHLESLHQVGFLWAFHFGQDTPPEPALERHQSRWLPIPRYSRNGHSRWRLAWPLLERDQAWTIDPLEPQPFPSVRDSHL